MARMIPPSYPAQTPTGERDLFNKLREDPDTRGWVVLHSLDVKGHASKIEGELDMVILVPRFGVLCVEVKGCSVSRKDGKWIYPYGSSFEGPFKQASRSMHSLRSYLVGRDRTLSGLIFFSAAIFTHVDFDEQSPEWHSWQFINRRQFMRLPISSNVINILSRAHSHVANSVGLRSWYDDSASRPSETQVDRITTLLRANFEYGMSARSDVERLEQTICRFTEEQFDALDLLEDNDRVVFKGPAGTGKTFVAMEVAKRAVAAGRRVLFVCYNNLLGGWLKAQTSTYSGEPKMFQCRTFHSLMLELVDEKAPEGSSAQYWRRTLPIAAADRLLDDARLFSLFDMLIVDEAQDLLEDEYLDVFDLLLRGGLAGGRWVFFGDFERQAIYDSPMGAGALQAVESLRQRAPRHAISSLRINCRNAEPIADLISITSGLAPGYRRVLHSGEGADVDPVFYSSNDNQQQCLVSAIVSLRGAFKLSEIVVLSMRSDDNSCAGKASTANFGVRLAPIRKTHHGQAIPYVSVHAFKGMEASAVIITDIESLNDEKSRALLYVGMSRARIRLFLLMHESCRIQYGRLLDAGLATTSRK